MRKKILVPVVLFGCLYAGVASAKGPQLAMGRGSSPQMHTSARAEAPAAVAPIRTDARRHSEMMTQRSGTSIQRTYSPRQAPPVGNASEHQQILRGAVSNMLPPVSENMPVDGDDGVTTATADQASA